MTLFGTMTRKKLITKCLDLEAENKELRECADISKLEQEIEEYKIQVKKDSGRVEEYRQELEDTKKTHKDCFQKLIILGDEKRKLEQELEALRAEHLNVLHRELKIIQENDYLTGELKRYREFLIQIKLAASKSFPEFVRLIKEFEGEK
jgi:septal ring factor EnvC (AmiA/AmiB activator)